jgi:Sec-independent protein translocase protein TatA
MKSRTSGFAGHASKGSSKLRLVGIMAFVVLGATALAGCATDNTAAINTFCAGLSEGRAQASTTVASLGDGMSGPEVLRQRRALEQTADRLEDLADDVSRTTSRSLERAFDAFDNRLEELADDGSVEQRTAGAQTALTELDATLQKLSDETGCK